MVAKQSRPALMKYYPFRTKTELDAKRRKASAVIIRARLDGAITDGPCEVCGKLKSDAHHENYAQPRAINWLCRKHHLERHRALRIGNAPPLSAPYMVPRKVTKQYGSHLTDTSTIDLTSRVGVEVARVMAGKGTSIRELARRTKTSKQYLHVLFASGFRTLKVISAVAEALRCDVEFRLVPRNTRHAA